MGHVMMCVAGIWIGGGLLVAAIVALLSRGVAAASATEERMQRWSGLRLL